jgi:formylglycine-generating enzyme required for sulfatase activity
LRHEGPGAGWNRVRPLAEALKAQRWSAFWDRTIPPGKTWHEVIDAALHKVRCVIVAWSEASIQSSWVREEAEEGRGRKILVPVLFAEVKPPIGFRSIQTASLVNWDGRPTAEEWEYAARAGTETAYWWGDEIGKNRANCNGCGSQWDYKQTAPVGSFAPNPWGLYDTAGNVWEWVQDCWHKNYEGAPEDGSKAWKEGGDCSLRGSSRVVRGGSWFYLPRYVRSALRDRNEPDNRNDNPGFRLAQDE